MPCFDFCTMRLIMYSDVSRYRAVHWERQLVSREPSAEEGEDVTHLSQQMSASWLTACLIIACCAFVRARGTCA